MSGAIAAVIGGSGFARFLDPVGQLAVDTPYGPPSTPIALCDVGGRHVAFLARHGDRHQVPPHRVNYRANLWALRSLGVQAIYGCFASGALDPTLRVGDVVVPDQLVDRTWGRDDTFHDDFTAGVHHAPFADPYDAVLRRTVLDAGDDVGVELRDGGTVVVIQGPRFGTRAEGAWYAGQGWHLVNMTQYPEAVLARELDVPYVGIGLVTDADSGDREGDGVRQEDVFAAMDRYEHGIRSVLVDAIGRQQD